MLDSGGSSLAPNHARRFCGGVRRISSPVEIGPDAGSLTRAENAMVSSDNIVRPLAWFVAVESAISAIIAPIAVRLVERVRELKAELEPFRRTLKLLSADTAAADASPSPGAA